MGQKERINYLMNRYMNSSCTRREMDELFDYIAEHPEDKQVSDLLLDAWQTQTSQGSHSRLSWGEMEEAIRERPMLKSHSSGIFWRAAACVLVLVMVYGGFALWKIGNDVQYSENSSFMANAVETAKAEHRLIVLPDGSKVWINGGSKVTSAPDFNRQTREVTLHGEAFFDIRREVDRPFIIKTGDVKTTVLGTAFNIRAFPDEKEVIVTVTRGKVVVQAENQEAGMVTANEQITVDLRSEKVEANTVDASAVTQWIKDDLILHEVTMDEVEEILEELYSVDIVFDNIRLKGCRFTSTFLKDATLEQVLTAICLVNNATFDVDEKVITIYGEGCNVISSNEAQ